MITALTAGALSVASGQTTVANAIPASGAIPVNLSTSGWRFSAGANGPLPALYEYAAGFSLVTCAPRPPNVLNVTISKLVVPGAGAPGDAIRATVRTELPSNVTAGEHASRPCWTAILQPPLIQVRTQAGQGQVVGQGKLSAWHRYSKSLQVGMQGADVRAPISSALSAIVSPA